MPEDTQAPPEQNEHMLSTHTAAVTEPQTYTHVSTPAKNSPGVLILQWLTYAFWGWTIFALTYLTAISINYFVNPEHTSYGEGDIVTYSLAAVVVLLIIAVVCDIFYSKREPLHKTGAATVIMIIHAVIFALCGIGSVIVAVFAVVNMLINTVSSGNQTALYTGLIIAVVYAATLLRTIRPTKLQRLVPFYWGFMVLVTVLVTVLGIVGPIAHERATRTDRLIESGLGDVSAQINRYADSNQKLPASLGDVRSKLTGDAADIVEQNLVEYTPGKAIMSSSITDLKQLNKSSLASEQIYEYELCVTYKAAQGDTRYYDDIGGGGRPTSPSTYSHEAGRVCYDLATGYNYQY